MRILISLFLLGVLQAQGQWKSFEISPRGDTLNRIDLQGKRQGPWFITVPELRGERGYEEQGYFEKDKKELFAGAQKAATQRVKVQLILAKIATAEKISVSERDIDNFIYREAMRTQQKPDKLAQALGSDRAQLRSVQQAIIFDKAVDFVVSKAKVSVAAPAS